MQDRDSENDKKNVIGALINIDRNCGGLHCIIEVGCKYTLKVSQEQSVVAPLCAVLCP